MSVVTKNSKLKLVKPMGPFNSIGEICEVVDVTDEVITFRFGNVHLGCISYDELDRYFEVVKSATITKAQIDKLFARADYQIETVYDKCTLMTVRLENGFVLTASSACVDPENYDERIGRESCERQIKNKLWELEGYRLQCELYNGQNV